MAVTLGVAPLLFAQVLYGSFFYTSNILLAWWWLGIVPLVIANLYLFYYARKRMDEGRGAGVVLPTVVLAVFVIIAVVLVGNAMLTQSPRDWQAQYAHVGTALYLGGPAFAWRLLLALFALSAAGGTFLALMGGLRLAGDGDANAFLARWGLSLAAAATVPVLIAAAGLAVAVFPAGASATWCFYPAVGAMVAAGALGRLARRAPSLVRSAVVTVSSLAGLVLLAVARDVLRAEELSPFFRPHDVPVNAQYGPFVVFLVVFLAGLVVLAYLVKLARGPAERAD
jgi:hypothetical protein